MSLVSQSTATKFYCTNIPPGAFTPLSTQLNDTASTVSMDDELDAEQQRLKDLLKNLKFTGNFHEKRYVESLHDYRDLITIDPAGEPAFVRQLEFVKDKLMQSLRSLPCPVWIGATVRTDEPPHLWTIWTELPNGTPFGAYRFKVEWGGGEHLSRIITQNNVYITLSFLVPNPRSKPCASNHPKY